MKEKLTKVLIRVLERVAVVATAVIITKFAPESSEEVVTAIRELMPVLL